MRQVMTELQQYVQQHQILINRELVNEDKLKITVELLEEQLKERTARDLQTLEDTLKRKIKKRLTAEEMSKKLLQKVDRGEYQKQADRLDGAVQVLGDRVDHELPAFKVDLLNALKSKAETADVTAELEKKVDNKIVDSLIERVNTMQEKLEEAIKAAAAKAAEGSADEDEEASDRKSVV